ncbi:MBL fold metallo-hydrolase [Alteromonas sp. NFXS44]|uniref:MBL fold metallo-hydrolase n=1 Tax=Alteromonas sp. NFXS44 TaxID=2818435 RepID=UPI0032DE9C3F
MNISKNISRSMSALGVVSILTLSLAAQAEPTEKYQQAAGFYRQMVGDVVVTAIYDGFIGLNPGHLSGMSQKQIQEYIFNEYQKTSPLVQTAVNAFLIDDGQRLVLVDSGSSDSFGPTMGNMVDNIRAAGFSPEEVDDVILTHMHPDHAAGVTLPNGKAAFPNATVWAAEKDAQFWLNNESASSLPESQRVFFPIAQNAIAPYKSVGKFKTFKDSDMLFSGIKIMPSNGHTPGHTSYLLSSGSEKLLLWGDIIHVHSVQLEHPEVSIEVDVNPEAAIESRKLLLAQATKERWMIASPHLPFPGLGHLQKNGKGYRWIPVEYRNPINSEQSM